MALNFSRCIFEILGKLTSIQLNALCVFLNSKIGVLEQDIRKALSVTDSSTNAVVSELESLTTSITKFNDKIRQSALFDVARTLSPNCGPLADVFGGAFGVSQLSQQAAEDATFFVKQVTSASAQANNVKNQLLDVTAALKDICTIAQVIIQNRTTDPDFLKEQFDSLAPFFRQSTEESI